MRDAEEQHQEPIGTRLRSAKIDPTACGLRESEASRG